MKTILTTNSLLLFAPLIQSIVVRKPSLDWLQCVRIRSGGGNVRIQATDLDRSLDIQVGESSDDFDALVPWAPLYAAMKKKPETIALEYDGNLTVKLSYLCEGVLCSEELETNVVKRWELHPKSFGDLKLYPVSNEFLKTLSAIRPCISTDDTRYVLCGIFVDVENGKIVGTDGRVLASYGIDIPRMDVDIPDCGFYTNDGNKGFIIPDHKFLHTKLAQEFPGAIGLTHSLNLPDNSKSPRDVFTYQFEIGPATITFQSKLIEGRYPTYRNVIPQYGTGDVTVTLNSEEIWKKLKALSLKPDTRIRLIGKPGVGYEIATPNAKFEVKGECDADVESINSARGLQFAFQQGFNTVEINGFRSALVFRDDKRIFVTMPLATTKAA